MPVNDINSFRSVFRGQVFEPADVGYDEARQIWNASVRKRPALLRVVLVLRTWLRR